MIRPVRADGSIDTGGVFVPITRRRVIDRISSAAMQRVVLIVAPAGYGKSVALRQYLDVVDTPRVRFDVLSDHAGLLGFLRGLSDALEEIAPDARATLAGAYEKNAMSPSPGSDLALWMYSHLKSYRGIVAIDDLHIAQEDREVTRFLSSLIDRTKGRVQWILASRSTLGLPIGTWLAYGDSDLAVDEHDLKFSAEEARDAAKAFRLAVRDEELYELLNLTDGWATAMSFALRSSTRSVDLRNISTMTREMVYRYLAEQVYETLDEEERRFIETASLLGGIDVQVMTEAGFDRAASMVHDLRQRVAFIYEREPNRYSLHDLFREFAFHQLNLRGKEALLQASSALAATLLRKGDLVGALRMHVQVRDGPSLREDLEAHGLQLVSQGYADEAERGLAALAEWQHDGGPVLALLRASIALARGRYAEGEALLRASLAQLDDPTMRADAALRLAVLIANRGEDVEELLDGILHDERVDHEWKIEARALLAGSLAVRGEADESRLILAAVESALDEIQDQERVAKIGQRVGFAYVQLHETQRAVSHLKRAAEISSARGMWSTAARSYLLLSRVALMTENQPSLSLWNAQQAASAAGRAGDYSDLQTSLLMILSVETRRGNAERAQQVERQLAELGTTDVSRGHYIASSQAQRHVWNGRFADAHRLFASIMDRQALPADRVMVRALYSLTLALDGQTKQSAAAAAQTLEAIDAMRGTISDGELVVESARLLTTTAEILNGRFTAATRLLKQRACSQHEIAECMRELVEDLLRTARTPSYVSEDFDARLEAVRDFGFGSYARCISVARERLEGKHEQAELEVALTPSELKILRALASGMAPKDIAADMGRSVYTVQTHVQNLIEKLGCHGRSEAIAVARRRGLLAAGSNGPT